MSRAVCGSRSATTMTSFRSCSRRASENTENLLSIGGVDAASASDVDRRGRWTPSHRRRLHLCMDPGPSEHSHDRPATSSGPPPVDPRVENRSAVPLASLSGEKRGARRGCASTVERQAFFCAVGGPGRADGRLVPGQSTFRRCARDSWGGPCTWSPRPVRTTPLDERRCGRCRSSSVSDPPRRCSSRCAKPKSMPDTISGWAANSRYSHLIDSVVTRS